MKVCLNPGHCPGIDPGAIGPNGTQEADVVKDICDRVKVYLQEAGVEVVYIQSDSLAEICYVSNSNLCDVFVSVHCNSAISPDANGTEIFTSRGQTNADLLATDIMNQVSNAFPDLYVRADYLDGDVDREAGFYVLNNTDAPAVLLETIFISNPWEEEFINKNENRTLFAKAIARGITDYQLRGL